MLTKYSQMVGDVGVPFFMMPQAISSYFLYFTTEAGNDAFYLVLKTWLVGCCVIEIQLNWKLQGVRFFEIIYLVFCQSQKTWVVSGEEKYYFLRQNCFYMYIENWCCVTDLIQFFLPTPDLELFNPIRLYGKYTQ